MIRLNSIRELLTFIACAVVTHGAIAQADGFDAFRNLTDTVELHSQKNHSSMTLYAYHEAGSFRRPFDPSLQWRNGISTDGVRKLAGWSFRGSFNYAFSRQKNVWRAGVSEPYRNNPYIWADTAGGDWTRHVIQSYVRMSSPIKSLHAFGLEVGYTASQGARETRPKPLYRLNHIAVSPSVTLMKGWLNINGGLCYEYRREEDEMGGAYTSGNVLLYRLRGYGTFDKTSFISGVRFYNGHRGTAFALMRGYTQSKEVIFSGQFSIMQERVVEGIAEPTLVGSYNEVTANVSAMLIGRNEESLSAVVSYSYVHGIGVDPAFDAINVGLNTANTRAKLSRKLNDKIQLLSIAPFHQSQRNFDVISDTNWNVRSAGIDVAANVLVGDWQIRQSFIYSKVYDTQKTIRRPTEVSATIVVPYLEYLAETFIAFRTNIFRDFAIAGERIVRVEVNVSALIPESGTLLSAYRLSVTPTLTLFMK